MVGFLRSILIASLVLCCGSDSASFGRQGAHNGGITQLNFWFAYSDGYYAFINHLKLAEGQWVCAAGNVTPEPTDLDSNGYPQGVTCASYYTVFRIPSRADRPVTWVVDWVGTGSIAFHGFNFRFARGYNSKNLFGTNGRAEIIPDARNTRVDIRIAPNRGSPISQLRFYPKDEEADLKAGGVFSAKFKQRIQQMGIGTIRVMDWVYTNDTNLAHFNLQRPETYFTYAGAQYRTDIWGGTTTNSGDDYFLAYSRAQAPVDRTTIQLKWNASATGTSVTLNGFPVLSITASALSPGRRPVAGLLSTLVFDATFNSWLKFGGDSLQFSQGLQDGVPRSIIARLANELGLNIWDQVPYLGGYDFAYELGSFYRDNLNYGLLFIGEWANEIWGGARLGFNGTTWCINSAAVWWPGQPNDQNNCYGKMASITGQGLSAAFSNDRSRYRMVVGLMTHGVHTDGTPLASNNARANSEYYVKDNGGDAFYAAYNWATDIAIANYYAPTQYRTSVEANTAFVYSNADAATQTAYITSYINSVYVYGTSGSLIFGLPRTYLLYNNWKAWALSFGIAGMRGYEGGYSPDFIGSQVPAPTASITNITKGTTTILTLGYDLNGNPWTATPGIDATTTGNTTNGSAAVTNIPDTSILRIGNPLSGTGIPVGAQVLRIDSATQITMTANATATNTGVTIDFFTGMQFALSGIVGPTELNGNTFKVIGAVGNRIEIDVDSAMFGDYKGGGTVNFPGSANFVNNFRRASRSSPLLEQITVSNYQQFILAGGTEPSCYVFTGAGIIWSVFDPNIFAEPLQPQVLGIQKFNRTPP